MTAALGAGDAPAPFELSDVTEQAEAYRLLEQRVAARTRELSALYEVTAVAADSLDLDTVLAHSLDQILHVMSCWTGGVWLGNGPRGALRLAASRGIGSPPDTLAEQLPQVDAWSRQVVELGRPLVVPNIDPTGARLSAECGREARAAGADHPGACQVYVGVPMRARGRVLGALGVLGAPGQQFSPEEIALLSAIADQVAIAVENARLHRQAQQLAVAKERARLARELHDSVTQWLYSVTLFADTINRMLAAGEPERVPEYLDRLGAAARQALREMRLLVHELRPPTLEEEGLVGALRLRLSAVERRAGLEATITVEGRVDLPPPIEEALYQIAREALNNSLKHAFASRIVVRLRAEDGLVEMTVSDDGRGFDPRAAEASGGLGLTTMRERAEALGGTLSINSAPERGTTVAVHLRSPQPKPANTES